MGGLSLKPMPKIVTKSDGSKSANRPNKSLDSKPSKNSSQNTLNKSLIASSPPPPPTSSILSGNSLNLSSSRTPSHLAAYKSRLQLIRHTENLLKHRTQKSVSLLQKSPAGSPGKMQSLLPKRSILNTMNSNLIANQYNSSNLLINSLMKTTTNVCTNSLINQQEKAAACSSSTPEPKLVDDKMIRVIKLCVTKLEFSSPLFRRIATKMSFLYIKPQYEHVRNYERFCGTSNKAVLKQVMNRGHTLKYKPSGNRSRMLRSNEIVDGKVMISWQRSAYVHVYTFNRRQRLRRYRQISMDLGFEHRQLQIMYGLKKVTLNRILECPCCKKRINPNLHYCVVSRRTTSTHSKRLRSSAKTTSLLKRSVPRIKFNDSVQTSDYVSNESDNSLDLATSHSYGRERRSLLEDSSKINLQKLSPVDGQTAPSRRCPTLLLDSSNYKTNQNSISNIVVKRMDSKELNKKMNSMQRSLQSHDTPAERLQIRKVDSLQARSLFKCRVIDQHNFAVSSLENSISIVFK